MAALRQIQVIDVNGNPLEGVHLKYNDGTGTITNANGIANLAVQNQNARVTISHVGKRTQIADVKNLGSLITMQEDPDNNLPPVVIGGKKSNTWIYATFGILAGIGLLAAAANKPKKVKM